MINPGFGPHMASLPAWVTRIDPATKIGSISGGYCQGPKKLTKFRWLIAQKSAVMAMATSYNWLFQWDEIHSINGVFLVMPSED